MIFLRTITGLKSIIAFLTIIPMGNSYSLKDMGEYMPLFPIVGGLIGVITGLFAYFLLNLFPGLVVGVLTLAFILLITGVHHTDGLLDFGDGIMFQGSPEKKIAVMHDKQTGAGGISFGIIFLMLTAISIGFLNREVILPSLIVTEISAKLAMVSIAWFGRSAYKGLGEYCVNAMHGKFRILRLLLPLILCLIISFFLLKIYGFIIILSVVLISFFIVLISNRHFNGITGDVFGATNDISRSFSLLLILAMFK